MLNWLVYKSGSFIFILCKIVTSVWLYVRGSMCTTCTPVIGGQLLEVGWFLPSPLLRQGLSHFCRCTSYYRLRSTNCQSVLLCAPLFYIGMQGLQMCVTTLDPLCAEIELKGSGLQGELALYLLSSQIPNFIYFSLNQ